MTYHTAAYKSADSQYGLILQQLTRRDGIPAHFSCVWKKVTGLSKRPAEYLLEWFYDILLPAWERRSAGECITKAESLFWKEITDMRQKRLLGIEDSYAILLTIGAECFYAWQGQADICLLQTGFGKMKLRRLDGKTVECRSKKSAENAGSEGKTENAGCAILEPQARLLLCNHTFVEVLAQERISRSFHMTDILDERQLEKYLTEIAREAQRDERAGGDVAAICFQLAD